MLLIPGLMRAKTCSLKRAEPSAVGLARTYDSVVITPGSHLNVLIGPNGTGKSSIVCAICLGLAGKPSLLGRASQMSDFVKHGCQKAVIEIELSGGIGCDTFTIRREIDKRNQSDWSVNGRRAVEECVARMKIQVGNLCQFLPQDKVADFAKMGPVELLESTEKAVGAEDLYNNHQRLKSSRDTSRRLEAEAAEMQHILELESAKNRRLEQDIKNHDERQKHLEAIALLQQRRVWVEYSEKKSKWDASKTRRDEAAKALQSAKAKLRPQQEQLKTAHTAVQEADAKIKKQTELNKKQAVSAAALSSSISNGSEKVAEIHEEYNEAQKEEEERQRKVATLTQKCNVLTQDLANMPAADMKPQLDELHGKMRDINNQMTQIGTDDAEVKRRLSNVVQEVTGTELQLKKLQDVASQWLEILRRAAPDAHQALIWLRANGHLFTGQIFEPIQTIINVTCPAYAKHVEAHIPYNDMVAFVCEQDDDMLLFLKLTRDEPCLKVNAVRAPTQLSNTFQPRSPITNYTRNYGFRTYMRETFTCPDPVMAYLCEMYKVHQMPIGDNTKKLADDVKQQCPEFPKFFTENHSYVVKKYKYSGAVSSISRELRPAQRLTSSVDQARHASLKKGLTERKATLDELDKTSKSLNDRLNGKAREMEAFRKVKQKLQSAGATRRQLQQKITASHKTLERLETEAIDLDQIRHQVSAKVEKATTENGKLVGSFHAAVRKCETFTLEKVRQGLLLSALQRRTKAIQEEIRRESSSVEVHEREVETLKEEICQHHLAAKELLSAAQKLSGVSSCDELPEQTRKELKPLPMKLTALDDALHEVQARADCTSATDESVVVEYKKRDIVRLTASAARKAAELDRHVMDMAELRRARLAHAHQRAHHAHQHQFHAFCITAGPRWALALRLAGVQ